MLAILGFITIVILLALIMTNKATPVTALIAVPTVAALIGGFGKSTGDFIIKGITSIAPTGTMFIFATLFFGILTDAGTFDPIIKKIFKLVGRDPVKIVLGTAILSMFVHLDGNGAVTFLVVIPALLPLFDAVGMKRTTLATVVALSAGLVNMEPWGGVPLRAMSVLKVSSTELFNPLLVPILVGAIFILFIDYRLAKKEVERIGKENLLNTDIGEMIIDEEKQKLFRPKLFWVNILTIIITIGILIKGMFAPTAVFMISFTIALIINYPNVKEQRQRIDAHAKEALLMSSILFAAGAFVGIMQNSGMIESMAKVLISIVPNALGQHLAVIVGIIGMPASLIFDPDSFYFGVLPVIAETAKGFGVPAIEIGRAALLGQMTTGFPISPLTGSTFLLIGLSGVELGEHQKKTIPYAFAVTIVMLITAVFIGVIKF
ncbi:CitMHS family transporter [Clostridium beijerinckii]|uniref:Citrate transporter n=1 Tax=Clostridium beijerinckii TaxID=1520 RepID=A0AAW3WFP5_CLOBE|nr:citrate:proton symporter [Clostridium beijerinckii]MBC2460105.1 citrate transporter [Clostridium beijerinckii]MBC2477598.1 citrate transporter [Clostridium beijerinckii]NOV60510.1 CitMHS family citrate-Mg2+:H+ or citrate-Ca2+:H+ symporter [Clostridium beijerinckii]NOV70712.1 CitMHS family citrate-Mg2+:H+ or citrate-Ca2+:H+ symporter [Clostridium beijerinckii]NOW33630.1 CitMHS family citrate-Mg2+:H+ or citrate-Ca2+:H+ symporter [Clostridium beijerinckii]